MTLLFGFNNVFCVTLTRILPLLLICVSTIALSPLYDVLRNKNIVFLGDSITRYQYITLVLSLHLPDANMTDHLVISRSWSDWNTYFKVTNHLLSPYEICDCFIPNGSSVSRHLGHENRYYNGPHNISVSYIQWLGDNFTMSGHHPLTGEAWRQENIDDILHHIVLPLSPDAIIINAGHWPVLPSTISRALRIAKDVVGDGLVIWKTITPLFNRSYPTTFTLNDTVVHLDVPAIEHAASNADVCILNTTAIISTLRKKVRHIYVDRRHFRISVYEAFNEQLLYLLAKEGLC